MNSFSRSCRLLIAKSRSVSTVPALSTFSSFTQFIIPSNRVSQRTTGYVNPVFQYGLAKFSSDAAPLSKEHIEKLVKNNKVVVFMKGVPDEPRCGFSNAVVQVLRMHGVTSYDSHDVLQDENIRQGIKDYTNWPTIPQVFINGEFVGGCDILIEMHKNGELVEQLSKVGIKSALLDEAKKDS
ncbi:Glutaredoxin-related protein 5, mitochondrial [Orchesella cincta]|uniref:Glutaredoxin-related protein 5, mitochondrial n=1 Tax=Orchesella cincta TaxID=48709 RepID=A0A1D2NIA3_ORCCI|nr:Glutaredoxin-related protein 5, mitochondrial [Orchesella cincta]